MGVPASKILEDLQLGVWVGRVPGPGVSFVNRAYREIHGLRGDSTDGAGLEPSAHRVLDRSGHPYPSERMPFRRVVATGAAVAVDDMVIERADGSRVSIRASGQPLSDGEGRLTHVVVTVSDITREAAAEAERERFAARLELVVGHAPIALWSVDQEGIITLSEGAGLKALGVRPGELVGKSVFELYRDHPTIPGYIRQCLQGRSLYYTVQVGELTFDTFLAPVLDSTGAVKGALGVSHDMSELHRLQAAAIQDDRVMALGMLAASVAHEINNPLTYVLGYLERLELAHEQQEHALAAVDGPRASWW